MNILSVCSYYPEICIYSYSEVSKRLSKGDGFRIVTVCLHVLWWMKSKDRAGAQLHSG